MHRTDVVILVTQMLSRFMEHIFRAKFIEFGDTFVARYTEIKVNEPARAKLKIFANPFSILNLFAFKDILEDFD